LFDNQKLFLPLRRYLKFNKKKYIVMAIPIKSVPVLTGKAAREFHERWKNFVDDTPKEYVQAADRKWREYFAKQEKMQTP
jgi:hypothetical protein